MNKQLLIERNLFEYKAENIKGKLVLRGKIQACDQKNQNGRIYPRNVLERELKNYEVLIKERRALGELDHSDLSIVELKSVSHLVTRVWWEGNDLWGDIEVLDGTPNGKTLRSLIEQNVKIGASSRSVGSIKESSEGSIVQDDLVIVALVDAVSDPSTREAFMYPLKESFDPLSTRLITESGNSELLFSKEYRINRILNKIICNCEDRCEI